MTHTLLPNRAIIRLRGADIKDFLQGIITNDVNLLDTQPAIFAAMLSPQGKLLHDFFITKDGDDLLLDTEAHLKDALLKKLKLYRLRAKVDIVDESEAWQVYAIWKDMPATAAHLFMDPRHRKLGWRQLIRHSNPTCHSRESGNLSRDRKEYPRLRGDDKLNGSNDEAGFDAYDQHRLSLGIPDGSRDATARTLVMENGYDQLHGISFEKGCYVGQEVTARMHYRKSLPKCLHMVSSESPLPESGTDIMAGDESIGEMRSSNGNNGLALIRIANLQKALEKRIDITANSISVSLTLPDYMKAKVESVI